MYSCACVGNGVKRRKSVAAPRSCHRSASCNARRRRHAEAGAACLRRPAAARRGCVCKRRLAVLFCFPFRGLPATAPQQGSRRGRPGSAPPRRGGDACASERKTKPSCFVCGLVLFPRPSRVADSPPTREKLERSKTNKREAKQNCFVCFVCFACLVSPSEGCRQGSRRGRPGGGARGRSVAPPPPPRLLPPVTAPLGGPPWGLLAHRHEAVSMRPMHASVCSSSSSSSL